MVEELYIDYSIRLLEAAKRAERRRRRKRKMILEFVGKLIDKTMNFLAKHLRAYFKTEELGEIKDTFETLTKDFLSNEKSDFEKFKMLKTLAIPIDKVREILNKNCADVFQSMMQAQQSKQQAEEQPQQQAQQPQQSQQQKLWEQKLSKAIPETKANLCVKLNELYKKVTGEKERLEQKNFFVRLWYRFKLLPWWGKALIILVLILILALIVKLAYAKITPFRNFVRRIISGGSEAAGKAIRKMIDMNAKETVKAATVGADVFDELEEEIEK